VTETSATIDLTPSPRLLQVLGDIPLHPWQCLAELVDNSLDEISRNPLRFSSDPLRVDIDIEDGPGLSKTLVVRDNGIGMSRSELEVALRAGATTKARYGTLGLFGMGFNIATARLGTVTTVRTTREEDHEALEAVVDFAALQRSENFTAPLRASSKLEGEHGTTVKVVLKPGMIDAFSTPANLQTLRNQLGDVYSYLLRDSVPGLKEEFAGVSVPARIFIAGEQVRPKIPCIMSDARTVMSYGQPVNAVQYIEKTLTEATACLACGYWDRSNGPTECFECGSPNIQVLQRKVWGWIGVQRYIDASHFGIDFIRFGRKILKQDKDIFKYEDPDTLQVDVEYPIEMPANRGRLVGEIHLDHVPVTYQKNAFDTQHRDWIVAREIVRGPGPLKPRSGQVPNSSPLALMFSAFRRNDPGMKYLTPGDGTRALHAKAKEWAGLFDRGVPQYINDDEWYESAKRHDGGGSTPKTRTSPEASPDSDEVDDLLPPLPDPAVVDDGTGDVPQGGGPRLTRDEELASARAMGVVRSDLGTEVTIRHGIGTWTVEIIETSAALTTPSGLATPVTNGPVAGNLLEILVSRDHLAMREFGQGARELAFLQAADILHQLKAPDVPVAVIYAEIVTQVEDLRTTAIAIQERIEGTLSRVRQFMIGPVSEDPVGYWERLDAHDKQRVEEAAAVTFPNTAFREVVTSGEFVLVATGEMMAKLVAFSPATFFDGTVFRAAFAARQPAARERLANKASRALASLGEFLEDPLLRQPDDLRLALVTLDSLESQLRAEDALS